jgi:membrane protease YdiL (CAAX protease family)
LATFGEEFGWTGYLLPTLLPLGKWSATIIYGLIWGLWHAPVIAMGYNYPGHPFAGVAMMCLFTVALAMIQASLRIRYGSVLLTTWLHACVNAQGRGIFPAVFSVANPLYGGFTGFIGLFTVGLIGVFLLARTPESKTRV